MDITVSDGGITIVQEGREDFAGKVTDNII